MFGQSVFETVVARLKAEAFVEDQAEDEDAVAGMGVRGLPSGFAGLAGAPMAGAYEAMSGRQAEDAYRSMIDDDDDRAQARPAAAEPPEPVETVAQPVEPEPAHLLRTTPEDVASDLGMTGRETPEDLAVLRRAFARLNHPDRAPVSLRDNATQRMTIANMLIDETLRRIHVSRQLGL